jgi:short subunit dehydrogenase-like uncharacterized protein
MSREFDVVIFGATGYTGEHTARALSKMAASGGSWAGVRWAIAGRSPSKLDAISKRWSLKPTGIIVADVTDEESLRAMAARGGIVMNATGPYRFYGEAVVTACIASKTDYVDLCGEPEFIDRCLLKHNKAAKAAGVCIVHSCAFDSVPADIGCLHAAMQFAPPALCAQADMYHEITVHPGADGSFPQGASGHATTFYAAVHGFGGAAATRKQRKQLLEQLEADSPGASKPPPPLGPKLRVAPGPKFHLELGKYTFLFPGSDVAVVRTSQRSLARRPTKPGDVYLTPQFGASFCVSSLFYACSTALAGGVFNLLAQRAWGRAMLLKYPQFFSRGVFSEEGPTEEMLAATSWRTTFFSKGWAKATVDTQPSTGHDLACRTSVSGPEPGYLATALMYLTMARTVLEDKRNLPVEGGVFTPGALVGSGGPSAVSALVDRLRKVGIRVDVDVPPHPITPKAPRGETRRPAWQNAMNALALSGWIGLLARLLSTWDVATAGWGSPLWAATLGLESICTFETFQIVLGIAPGNLVLGVTLHTIRMLVLLVIMPAVPAHLATRLTILTWCLTEIFRYPMFLTSHPLARIMRYYAPLVTFPMGAAVEAWAAYLALPHIAGHSIVIRCLVGGILPMNVFGGVVGYMGVLKRARGATRSAKAE